MLHLGLFTMISGDTRLNCLYIPCVPVSIRPTIFLSVQFYTNTQTETPTNPLYISTHMQATKLQLHPHDRPLQLPHTPAPTQTPLLAHEAVVDPLPHQATEGPILHQRPRLLSRQAADALHVDATGCKHGQDALVVLAKGILLNGDLAFELGEGEVERGNGGVVGLGGGGEDEAGVGERRRAGEVVEEPFDEGELVGVDRLVRVGDVMGVAHRVRQSVHAQQQGWTTGEGEFAE